MDGQYEPGERIRIAGLAATLGTSITPVREAIFRLVSERALEMKAATSVHVPILSVAQLREIQTVRMLLEGEMAESAATLITDRQLEILAAIQAEFIAAAAKDAKLASLHNRRFHFALMELAAQPTIASVVENMWAMMGPLLRVFHTAVPQRDLSEEQHKHHEVLAALRRRDPAGARSAIVEDIRWGLLLVEWLEQQNQHSAPARAAS